MAPETQDWSAAQPSPALSTVVQSINATEAGSTAILVAGVAGQRIACVTFNVSAATGVANTELRDDCRVYLADDTSGTIFAALVVSPESPQALVAIPWGAGQSTVGGAVRWNAKSRGGSGRQALDLILTYYLTR